MPIDSYLETASAAELRSAIAARGNDDIQLILAAIGLDATRKLIRAMGGGQVYIPSAAHLTQGIRHARLRAEFNGHNHNELAAKYGLSGPTVYKLLREGSK